MKYTVRITSPESDLKHFTTDPDPNSQPRADPSLIQQSFYDNVSPSNVLVTNVSVNLQPIQDPRKPVGVMTTRVITSTTPHPTSSISSSSQFSPQDSRNKTSIPSPEEDRLRNKFIRMYGNRRAPMVDSEGEEAPKDPKPSGDRRQSFESTLSTDSRESVVSAVSYRAENKVRRYFNY